MENQNQPSVPQVPVNNQQVLPNSVAALVLGIVSIPTCICYGIPGLACGIIAIVLGSKAIKLYRENPSAWSSGSYNNANAGRICGIIGVILSSLFLLYVVIVLLIYGVALTSIFSAMGNV